MLLSLASQRAEFLVLEWSGISWLQELVEYWKEHERGSLPGLIEFTVIIYIASTFIINLITAINLYILGNYENIVLVFIDFTVQFYHTPKTIQ